MLDIEIDSNQYVHANEYARPSTVGEPPCSRAQIEDDFRTPIVLDANANRMFSLGRFPPITLQELRHLRLCNKLNSLMLKF